MGQLIHFYAGDPETVGRAFTEHDYQTLRDPVNFPVQADFSLHLSPIDLEILTEEVHKLVGSGPTSLEESLARQVGGDGEECSADVVSPEWVGMMSARDLLELCREAQRQSLPVVHTWSL